MQHINSFLALGDSYTIGEAVPIHESFPYITTQLLRKKKISIYAPEIVAKTGWTSSELAEHLLHTQLNHHYDFVSLLIGVNNQYRNLSVDNFLNDFEFLVKKAIHFASGKNERVIILSIPDWGCTPFATDKNKEQIAKEIDAFNIVCKQTAKQYHTNFIDITTETREFSLEPKAIASDGLHFSYETHLIWAKKMANAIQQILE
ncbi:SGNH/GDSL hydrolase family protein [Sediminibacterium sp. TEGAF015]|uniref:SGNH/GDSL hydrolase family protein n=1 Tax=Sediminibacterium sp. TEGAF015 TaxID=575378 RepID=UPI002205507F|nr:GDSL-type esterase/lipase family protein [Sediminibacterium sp. TEGAF015]BDQ11469.1 lysophospholipase [Sediminibacterium sp. TEGAF015]